MCPLCPLAGTGLALPYPIASRRSESHRKSETWMIVWSCLSIDASFSCFAVGFHPMRHKTHGKTPDISIGRNSHLVYGPNEPFRIPMPETSPSPPPRHSIPTRPPPQPRPPTIDNRTRRVHPPVSRPSSDQRTVADASYAVDPVFTARWVAAAPRPHYTLE